MAGAGGGSPLCQKTTRATWEGPFLVLFPPPPQTPGQFRAPSAERKPSVPSVGDGAGLRKQEHREAQGNSQQPRGGAPHSEEGGPCGVLGGEVTCGERTRD